MISLTALTSLDLNYNSIGAEGAKALADALTSGSTALTSLSLQNNQLCGLDAFGEGKYDSSGIQALASALVGNTALTIQQRGIERE